MKELLKIMGIALAAMILFAICGLVGIALLDCVVVPLIGLKWTMGIMTALLFIIICIKIHYERKIYNG